MKTLNEHVNRMRQLFNAEHGIIKPLVSEQDEFDDMITKSSPSSKPMGDTKPENNNQSTPNPNYKNANDSFEDKDDLINKPGSGRKIIASIDATVKNNTKGTEEVVNVSLDEDTFANYFLDPTGTFATLTPDLLKMLSNYGYYMVGALNKSKYSPGDSLTITAKLPFKLGNSTIDRPGSKASINYAEKSISGNSTIITLNASVVENPSNPGRYYAMSISYEIDETSPFADFKKVNFNLHFK